MKKLSYSGDWVPDQGVAFKGAVRGDEHRYFTIDGKEGVMRVMERGGRWSHLVSIDGETVCINQGFGESQKVKAKKHCTSFMKRVKSRG